MPSIKCDFNCERCREIMSKVNEIYMEKVGMPLSNTYCLAELFIQLEEMKRDEELMELEREVFVKIVKEQIVKFLKGG